MRKFLCVSLACVAFAAAAAPARAAARPPYSDIPEGHWARTAVTKVAIDNDWLRISGANFGPTRVMTRKLFARALVRAFARDAKPNPDLTFTDLPRTDPYFPVANIAASKGWLPATKGAFAPGAIVQKRHLDRAFVLALRLGAESAGINKIAAGTTRLPHGSDLGPLAVGSLLRLHYNHPSPNDQADLLPASAVTRADVAYALWRATAVTATTRAALQRFRTIALPEMTDAQRTAVAFALRYVGYPYVYAGEWDRPVADGYCCGAQKQGGFDCSGWAWWVSATPQSGWDNTRLRRYGGWSLPERSSREMARGTTTRIAANALQPLDVVFFDADRRGAPVDRPWEAVDHAGIALGNGFMIHSSGGRAGVAIDWIGDGFWADTFLWGRRLAPPA